MAADPILDGSTAVADSATPATAPVSDPVLAGSTPAPATPTQPVEDQSDPILASSTAAPSTPALDPSDPIVAASSPVDPGAQDYIDQQRESEAQSLPEKAVSTVKGIGEGIGGFFSDTLPGIAKGAYNLATDPTLTPGQKMLATGNTVLSNLATLPYLAKNAAQGIQNIYDRNFGSGITDQEYARQWQELQDQNFTRRAFLNGGVQAMFGNYDASNALPATAEEHQQKLAPLLDVTNLIPFAGGAAAKLGRAATVEAGAAALKGALPSVGRRVASSLLSGGAEVTDRGANILDVIRRAPQRGLEAIGMPPEAAEKMAGAPIHLLAGAAGGAEAILPILAGEAAPSLLRQFSTVQRAASQAVLTGESTASFVQRMAQGTQGLTRTMLNALDQTGLARAMGTVGDVVGSGVKGGVLNPFMPLQFLAAPTSEEVGRQIGSNVGFGIAGAGAAHLAGETPAQVANRNYNDVVQFAGRLGSRSGAEGQLAAYNAMPFRAQVAVAQFANTRPDVDVVLKPGGDNTTSLPSSGRRTVTLNTSNPAAAVAHIAAHEYVHTLLMVGDNRSKVVSSLMGNPDLGTEGALGRWADGIFVPTDHFKSFIQGYTERLAQDGATVNAGADPDFYRQMAEEYYAEDMAPRLAGTNAAGETGLSRVYRTGDTISKLVDTVTGRSGANILDYLDRKYAQGRIAPRFGADALSASIAAGPHAAMVDGLRVLGMRALRENETASGKPQEYNGPGHVEPTFNLNELRQNPAAAAKLFGASNDLVFAPDGTLVGQRTRAQANAAARAQGKIWFDVLSRQDASKLPPGAVRVVARTDAKGKQVVELEGKFLTDGQVDALVKANGMNRYQQGALRQVNRALQVQDGNVYHVVYQTASNGKGRYATLASSSRDMVVRQIRVTKDHNIILDSFDVDQFLHNYDQMMQTARSTGGKPPIEHPEQALHDYLANQALGYTGAGQPLDAANPPTQPPARVFAARDAHVVNELFGVGTKDNAGVNPVFHEMDESGQDRSRSTFKSFRLDRINSLESTSDRLPVDYHRVKYNRSPNAGQEDEPVVRSAHGSQPPSGESDHLAAAAPAQVTPQPADRGEPAVHGGGRPDLRPQGDRPEPGEDHGQVPDAAGARHPDGAAHPDARGGDAPAAPARLLKYASDGGRRIFYSPSSVDSAPRAADEQVRELADRYRAAVPGLGDRHSGYAPVDEELSRRVADAYHALRSDPSDPEVQRAYDAFINETLAQWNAAHAAGYKFEPWLKGGQPYASSGEMLGDLRENKHLYYFPSVPEGGIGAFGEGEGVDHGHPLLREVGHYDGVPVVANDVFRAVHDMFGHAQGGFEFGPRGELNAYLEHRAMYTPLARQAMTPETMGQNSWVNFGPHLRGQDGAIPARGEEGYVHPAERPYAEQKAALLPPEVMRELEPTLHSPNINTPEFKRWFGDSKVVNEIGKPLILYHGTRSGEFTVFNRPDALGHHFGTANQANDRLRSTMWQTSSSPRAMEMRLTGNRVMPVYLSIQSPFRMEDIGDWSHETLLKQKLREAKIPVAYTETAKQALQKAGYDGVVYRNTGESNRPDGWDSKHPENTADSYIIFKPTQVKSALANYGTYDPSNPSILHSPSALDEGGMVKGSEKNDEKGALGAAVDRGARPGGGPIQGAGLEDVLRRGAGAVSPQQWYRDYLRQAGQPPDDASGRHLLEHAQDTGQIIPLKTLQALESRRGRGGVEHEVYSLPKGEDGSSRILKMVKPGKWGIDGDALGYFKNLHDLDTLTGGRLGIKVLGVTPRGTWPSVITTHNFIDGVHPTEAELRNYLEERGFERRPGEPIYDHLDSDVELWDAHRRNFIRTSDGHMFPIDLHIRGDVRGADAPRFGAPVAASTH